MPKTISKNKRPTPAQARAAAQAKAQMAQGLTQGQTDMDQAKLEAAGRRRAGVDFLELQQYQDNAFDRAGNTRRRRAPYPRG